MEVFGNLLLIEEAVVATAHELFPQRFLDLAESNLPDFVSVDGEVFKCFDSCFRCALRLEIRLQDVDIVIAALEVFNADAVDLLQYLGGVERWFRVVNGLDVLVGGFRSTKVRVSVRTRNHSRFVPGSWRLTSSPSGLTFVISRTD
jgi:hypothetical protein